MHWLLKQQGLHGEIHHDKSSYRHGIHEGKSPSSYSQDERLSRFKEFMIFLGIRHRMNPQGTEGTCWDIIAIRRNQDTDKP